MGYPEQAQQQAELLAKAEQLLEECAVILYPGLADHAVVWDHD